MPVCYCIVILTIAMIRKMVIVMINMMVITYRPLVGLEVPSKQYALATFKAVLRAEYMTYALQTKCKTCFKNNLEEHLITVHHPV